MTTYGLLIFPGAEEADFAGPREVFAASSALRGHADQVLLIAERPGPVRCRHGMRVRPSHVFGDHPRLDVVLVPGGAEASREMSSPAVTGWVARAARGAVWTVGAGAGTLLLHVAGPARGRRVTTRFAFADILEARGNVTVDRDARFVVDDRLVTGQGGSAGIDMALWLIGCLHGRDHARDVRRSAQFEPAPT